MKYKLLKSTLRWRIRRHHKQECSPDAGENIYYHCQQWFDPSKYPQIGRKLPDRVYSASDILEAVNNWSLDTVELKHNKFFR
jgi:hypothetical protein